MDTRTIFVAIGIAFLVFAMLLLVAERPRRSSPLALLVTSDLLIAAGVLLQAQRGHWPLWATVLCGNLLAWVGLEYQGWATLAMSGRPTSSRTRILVAAATGAVGLAVVLLPGIARASIATATYAVLFGLSAWAVATWSRAPRTLRAVTAGLFGVVAALYAMRALLLATQIVAADLSQPGSAVDVFSSVEFLLIFAGILSGAFSLLLLSRHTTELRIRSLLEETEALMATLPTGVAITVGGQITRVNPSLAQMLGYEVAELEGQPGSVLFVGDEDYEASVAPVMQELERTGEFQGEFALRDREGNLRQTWLQVRAVDWDPGVRHAVYALTDVTVLKELQAELARQASFDELTGLLNRRALLQRAGIELSRSTRSGRPLALAVLDLDRLKMINDGHGHAAGDAALVAVASAFAATFRDIDVTARIGGDEFAVVLPDSTLAQANAAMERFLGNLAHQEVRVDDFRVELGASVGVAEFAPGETLDALMARADRAMYASKRSGGQAVTARASDGSA